MSVQVNAYHNTNLGRMFARRNAPEIYGRQKNTVAELTETDVAGERVDTVSLSAFAPKPLAAEYFEEAVAAGREVADGGKLSAERTDRIRQDRVFTALMALAALGDDGKSLPRTWPGGLPRPTTEELDEARRRLAQRLQSLESSADPESASRDRLKLLERVSKRDFEEFGVNEDRATSSVGVAA